MPNSKIKIIYQSNPSIIDSRHCPVNTKKDTLNIKCGDIAIIYNEENLKPTPNTLPPVKIKPVPIDYSPQHISLLEKFLGPGAIAASCVALILLIMALYVTLVPVNQKAISYTHTHAEKIIPDEKEEAPLEVADNPLIIHENIAEELIHLELNTSNNEEVKEEKLEEFYEVQGEPQNNSTINFSAYSTVNKIAARASVSPGKKGSRREGRQQLVLANGGSRKTELAVSTALHWLRRHQNRNGMWSLATYHKRCGLEKKRGRCAGDGLPLIFDVGGTALSLLSYTGHGLDHIAASPFSDTIKNAKNYLIRSQDIKGLFGRPLEKHYIYNHLLSTLALADLCLMSEDTEDLIPAIQKGVEYISAIQNPEWAWRYNDKTKTHIGAQNDTSVTAWVVMALKTAKECGIKVDDKCFEGASRWLDFCYVENERSQIANYGYIMSENGNPAFLFGRPYGATACGLLSRQFLNESKGLVPCANALMEELPDWNGFRDMYYWYYGSLAMFQMGGEYWDRWNDAMKPTLVDNQNKKKHYCQYGSWNPDKDAYGVDRKGARAGLGGRVYTTALGALTLEVYYRYARLNK